MIPRMSRPANPHDNASCESFVKTLKREVYATEYRDLEHQRANIEGFIDRYYDRSRLRSALGYQSPKEFERALPRRFVEATMSFSGMRRSIDPIEIVGEEGSRPRLDESPAGYSLAGCSPAGPAASPAECKLDEGKSV